MLLQKIPKLSIAFLLVIITNNVNAQTATQHKFSLAQAVDFAKKNNVQVKNALLNIKIQEQSNRGVTAAAYPSISANVGTTYYIDIPTQLIPGQIFGGAPGSYIPVQFGTKYTTTAGVQLQQLLFDGQVFVGLQARSASMQISNTKPYEIN